MRKHRFFTANNLSLNDTVTLDPDISHHITRVLRLANDEVVYLFNNSGYEFTALIKSLKAKAVEVQITTQTVGTQESPLKINLAQVIAKGDKMELIIQKATELGVQTITPLYSERTAIKKIKEKAEHKLDHWYKIAIAASAQCWRNYVPIVNEAQSLESWLKQNNHDAKLILSPHGTSKKIRDLKITGPLTILIGPEGGFSDQELELALKHGFQAISLGPRILRTETAGLTAIAILQSMIGDL